MVNGAQVYDQSLDYTQQKYEIYFANLTLMGL